MALTAMDIYKLLPRTNCGECGTPTCLAFAMKLSKKQASLDDCPYADDDAKSALASASEPPIHLVKIGAGDNELEIGNETVMFRHEETFHNTCGIAAQITDELEGDDLDEKIEKINGLWFERVGEMIGVELIAVKETTGDAKKYANVVKQVVEKSKQTPILMSFDPSIIEAAFAGSDLVEKKPLIYAATPENFSEMVKLAKNYEVPLAVLSSSLLAPDFSRGNCDEDMEYEEGLDELAEFTPKIKGLGVNDLVLDTGSRDMLKVMNDLTQIRRQALKNNFRPLGYPTIAFADEGDGQSLVVQGSTYVSKYANIVVVNGDEPWQILPLLALRQNIYTDPRVPPAIESKIYEVGEVTPDSPVLMTTNFSLTYYTVLGEVEASRIPVYMLPIDTEGQSVLTAYSSEKLNAEEAAKTIKQVGLENMVNHKKIIIPGYVAVMSGALEAESGWDVTVGPREATSIPAFLRKYAAY